MIDSLSIHHSIEFQCFGPIMDNLYLKKKKCIFYIFLIISCKKKKIKIEVYYSSKSDGWQKFNCTIEKSDNDRKLRKN